MIVTSLRKYSLAQMLAFRAAGLISQAELADYCTYHHIRIGR